MKEEKSIKKATSKTAPQTAEAKTDVAKTQVKTKAKRIELTPGYFILNDLQDRAGARHSRRRVGRGIGSGKGKTTGRGHKGQKARSGAGRNDFEGGQMPLYRRLPKRGFHSHKPIVASIPLKRIEALVNNKSQDISSLQTEDDLRGAGLVSRGCSGVKIISGYPLKNKYKFVVSGVSESAKKAIIDAGGTVTIQPRVIKTTHNKKVKDKLKMSLS